ncbi:ABC transporter ATP-binding protein [Paraburkholderia heleia]|uniref:ABC transporter ATP-binding protein n=1 Tax=Paraburkholderia heleia TaxID=634127 RepID=UPI0031D63621
MKNDLHESHAVPRLGLAHGRRPLAGLSGAGEKRNDGAVRLRNLTKRYDRFCAVDDVSIDIAAGEFVTMLGPSGSGKTTVLNMISGLTEPTSGSIWIGDRDVTRVGPQHRGLGVVFQNYALFPHLSIAENVAFPLRMRRVGEADIKRKVAEMLTLVRLPDVWKRMPSQLSGGQQQRVALARALIFDPPVLLLDEPLSALDKKLRESMQFEIREIHRKLGLTVVNVTHDQCEALAMSDRVIIMRDGKVVQSGTPQTLYEAPTSTFVADFLGTSNFLCGTLHEIGSNGTGVLITEGGLRCRVSGSDVHPGKRVRLMLRPERIMLDDVQDADQRLSGYVAEVAYTGELVRYRVVLSDADLIEVTLQNRKGHSIQKELGSAVTVGWRIEDAHLFSEVD